MLIEFAAENFRSIRDEQRLSLVASTAGEHEATHVMTTADGERVLRAAAVFGANASGKSNLLLAMHAMRRVVLGSGRRTVGDAVEEADPFLLDAESAERPTTFEVLFVQHGVRYQYGFSVTRESVEGEWLYAFPNGRSQLWFSREAKSSGGSAFRFGEKLMGPKRVFEDATRDNALYLSTAVQLNSEALKPVFEWFRDSVVVTGSSAPFVWLFEPGSGETLDRCETPEERDRIVALLQAADLGIEEIVVDTVDIGFEEVRSMLPQDVQQQFPSDRKRVRFRHRGASPESEPFELWRESGGTQRLFETAGRLLDVLENGRVLVVDELGANLHPLMLEAVVGLFTNPEVNTSGAQLVFTTHDTNLLDQKLLRRDQFWLTDKDDGGATTLTPLTDFRPRKGVEPLETNYLRGRYGGVPSPRLPRAFREVTGGA